MKETSAKEVEIRLNWLVDPLGIVQEIDIWLNNQKVYAQTIVRSC